MTKKSRIGPALVVGQAKRFTQSITLILCVAIGLIFAWFVANLFKWLGLMGWLDSFYLTKPLVFWTGLVVSRWILVALWALVVISTKDYLKARGWFWFAQATTYDSTDTKVDQSETIAKIALGAVLVAVFTEFAIRLLTLTVPPYGG